MFVPPSSNPPVNPAKWSNASDAPSINENPYHRRYTETTHQLSDGYNHYLVVMDSLTATTGSLAVLETPAGWNTFNVRPSSAKLNQNGEI